MILRYPESMLLGCDWRESTKLTGKPSTNSHPENNAEIKKISTNLLSWPRKTQILVEFSELVCGFVFWDKAQLIVDET